MEGVHRFIRNVSKDPKSVFSSSSSSSSFDNPRLNEGISAALPSSDQSRVLISRPPRQVVSLWTCSKLCAICFAVGVVVGYTLKRRVRRWASKLLKRLKDDWPFVVLLMLVPISSLHLTGGKWYFKCKHLTSGGKKKAIFRTIGLISSAVIFLPCLLIDLSFGL